MDSDQSKSKDIDSNKSLIIVFFVAFVVVSLYILNFTDFLQNVDKGLSKDTSVWGTFGDYVGGILNPLIAAFAFYLIAKTYELQKTELKETRELLKSQTELAALTSWINANFLEIEFLQTRKSSLWKDIDILLNDENKNLEFKQLHFDVMLGPPTIEVEMDYENPEILKQQDKYNAIENTYRSLIKEYEIGHLVYDIDVADSNIDSLQNENDKLKSKIKSHIQDYEKLKGFRPFSR